MVVGRQAFPVWWNGNFSGEKLAEKTSGGIVLWWFETTMDKNVAWMQDEYQYFFLVY